MAKNNTEETRTAIDDLNDTLTGAEQKFQENKKGIVVASAVIAVIVIALLGYVYGIRQPGIEAANEAIAQADITSSTGNDSLALAQYMQVADEHGYDGGNRAKLEAAIILYQKGEYEKAIEYLKGYDRNETLIGAASLSLEGDCYANIDKFDEALACYDKAISASDNNPYYTPFFMIKQANIHHAQGNHEKELEVYSEIKSEYPEYAEAYRFDIDKYIERAKAESEQE